MQARARPPTALARGARTCQDPLSARPRPSAYTREFRKLTCVGTGPRPSMEDVERNPARASCFSAAWIDTISVLLAKGRARVGVADAATDWPRRIRDMQYLDHESLEAGA